jgi:hypothetical protein
MDFYHPQIFPVTFTKHTYGKRSTAAVSGPIVGGRR